MSKLKRVRGKRREPNENKFLIGVNKPGKVRFGDNIPTKSHSLGEMKVGKLNPDGSITYQAEVKSLDHIPNYSANNKKRRHFPDNRPVKINTYDSVKAAASRYGIRVEDILRLRDRGCEICGSQSDTRVMCIDHDHTTEQVRGCLCLQCNAAIGLLQDSSPVAILAAKYLVKHGK